MEGKLAGFSGSRERTSSDIWKIRLRVIKLFLILGLLLGAASLSWILPPTFQYFDLLLGVTFGLFAFFMLYRTGHFEYAIIATALSAILLNFFTIPTGTESRIVISLVIAVALISIWLLQLIVTKDREQILPSAINAPIILFVAVNLISYFWGNMLRDPLVEVWSSFPLVQLGALAVNILLPLLALMVANKVRDVKWLKILSWLIIGIGALVVVSYFFQLPTLAAVSNGARGLFATWVAALAFGLVLFQRNLSSRVKIFLLLLVAAWSYYHFVMHTFWLSGWIPLFAALGILSFFHSKKLFLVALVLGLVIFAVRFEWFYQNIYIANMEEGGAERLDLWRTNVNLVLRHPLFGTGPAGYAVYYMTYNPIDARSTHNNIFDILAQTGFIGFFVFSWMSASFILIGNRLRKAFRGRGNFEEAYANAVLAGFLAALLSMMLGDWVLPFAYNQTITGFDNALFTWIFIGGMAAMYQLNKSKGANKS
jgi:O-antigen ligase